MGSCCSVQNKTNIQVGVTTPDTMANSPTTNVKLVMQKQDLLRKQQETAKSSCSYILGNGEIVIPMNGATGEFPKTFPIWVQNDITPDEYNQIIDKLNSTTMPVFVTNQQLRDECANNPYNFRQNQQNGTKMATNMDIMLRDIGGIIYEINTTILQNKSIRLEECNIGAYIAVLRTPRLQHLVTDKGVKIIKIANSYSDNTMYHVPNANDEGVEGGHIALNQSNARKENLTTPLLG